MKNIAYTLIAGVICSVLAGCALPKKMDDIRVDGRQLEEEARVARLALHSHRTYPNRPMNGWWWADIVSVDGVPIPNNSAVVQLTPGEHTVEYACKLKFQLNDTGGGESRGSMKVNLQAGSIYFAYVDGKMSSYKSYGAAGIESKGSCMISSFQSQNPLWLN